MEKEKTDGEAGSGRLLCVSLCKGVLCQVERVDARIERFILLKPDHLLRFAIGLGDDDGDNNETLLLRRARKPRPVNLVADCRAQQYRRAGGKELSAGE